MRIFIRRLGCLKFLSIPSTRNRANIQTVKAKTRRKQKKTVEVGFYTHFELWCILSIQKRAGFSQSCGLQRRFCFHSKFSLILLSFLPNYSWLARKWVKGESRAKFACDAKPLPTFQLTLSQILLSACVNVQFKINKESRAVFQRRFSFRPK